MQLPYIRHSPFCEMCGAVAGGHWQTCQSKLVVLSLRPRVGDPLVVWTICNECHEGLSGMIHSLPVAKHRRVTDSEELQRASGWAAEWARRLRELRDEQGYQILSHKDRAELKPGQYLLETTKRKPAFKRGISKETRAYVLERNGYTCQMCGVAAGDTDPLKPNRTARLTMGHIVDKSKGGKDEPSNLRAVCTNCNEGLQNAAPQKPDRIQLLAQIRRATIDDQKIVMEWLQKKFSSSK